MTKSFDTFIAQVIDRVAVAKAHIKSELPTDPGGGP